MQRHDSQDGALHLLLESSRLATGLSALAPAQRAIAQRFRALNPIRTLQATRDAASSKPGVRAPGLCLRAHRSWPDVGHYRATSRRSIDACAISAISLMVMALPNELKSSATMTKASGPPITFSR
jgi:hypothetical protein